MNVHSDRRTDVLDFHIPDTMVTKDVIHTSQAASPLFDETHIIKRLRQNVIASKPLEPDTGILFGFLY